MQLPLMHAFALAMGLGAAATTQAAVTLSFSPSSQVVAVGDIALVDLLITGLGSGEAPSLGGYDLDVGFDPALLAFDHATFGDQLDLLGLGDIRDVTPGVGRVNLFQMSLDSIDDLNTLQADSFVMATMGFTVLGAGLSPLTLIVNPGGLADAFGDPLDVELVPGSVGMVPEPANSVLMALGIGLLALTVARRRRL